MGTICTYRCILSFGFSKRISIDGRNTRRLKASRVYVRVCVCVNGRLCVRALGCETAVASIGAYPPKSTSKTD